MRRAVLALLAAGLSLGIGGCGGDVEPPAPKPAVRPLKVMVIPDPGAVQERAFPGTVRAARRAQLSFEVPGRLIELPVKQGQRVRQGDLIARLDPRDFEARVKAAQAEYDKALAQFKRGEELVKEGYISRAEFDRLTSRRDVARADLDKAEKALEDTFLNAAFDGLIASRAVENFQEVEAKETIVELQDPTELELVVSLPENLMSRVRQGIRFQLEATFEAIPDRRFPVRVKEFATEADPATQTFEVVLALSNPEEANILPGMTATVSGRRAGDAPAPIRIAVPSSVLLGDADQRFVWVVGRDDHVVRRRAVTAEPSARAGYHEIATGLEPGEMVATAGVHHLEAGMRVKPVEKIDF
jgi:RND family efflux transporter MFP subunit